MSKDSFNQVFAELEIFACYKCTHDLDGKLFVRSEAEQRKACSTCFIHKAEARLASFGFDPLEGFDKSLAESNILGKSSFMRRN